MTDHRTPDELSLAELEALVEQRRRIERSRQLARNTERRGFHTATTLPSETVETKSLGESGRYRLRNRVLLFIEVAGALALALLLVAFLTNLESLNQAANQARRPTPGANAVWGSEELPGSPFPPTNPLKELPGSSFPPEPAPPALGIRLQSVVALPAPTPGPRAPTRIVISAIKIDWPVVEGDGWEELKQGIGHRLGTANPGERGNMVLSGHNDVYGEPFGDLEIIETGKYLKEQNPETKVIGADPVGSLIYDTFKGGGKLPPGAYPRVYKVEGIGEDFLPDTLDVRYLDDVIQVTDKESYWMTRELVRQEGLFCGGSSGTAC